jgi:hypothetical protein
MGKNLEGNYGVAYRGRGRETAAVLDDNLATGCSQFAIGQIRRLPTAYDGGYERRCAQPSCLGWNRPLAGRFRRLAEIPSPLKGFES